MNCFATPQKMLPIPEGTEEDVAKSTTKTENSKTIVSTFGQGEDGNRGIIERAISAVLLLCKR